MNETTMTQSIIDLAVLNSTQPTMATVMTASTIPLNATVNSNVTSIPTSLAPNVVTVLSTQNIYALPPNITDTPAIQPSSTIATDTANPSLSSNRTTFGQTVNMTNPKNSLNSFYLNGTNVTTAMLEGDLTMANLPKAENVSTSATSAGSIATPQAVFNKRSSHNLAVYHGQTPNTAATTLTAQCLDVNVDIVMLSALSTFNWASSNYPSINFGALCPAMTSQQKFLAPGLSNCSQLVPQIQACQAVGKKVLLSIGGRAAGGNISLSSANAANIAATQLWNLFGAGTGEDWRLRPFGNLTLDGFDIAPSNSQPAYLEVLGQVLKQLYTTDPSKSYYLSSSPSCPIPDPSIPTALQQICDWLFIQFFNSPSCNLNSAGFAENFIQHTRDMGWGLGDNTSAPMLYVGAIAWLGSAQTGYTSWRRLNNVIGGVRGYYGFGGMMLWDGAEGHGNSWNGTDYVQTAKRAAMGLNATTADGEIPPSSSSALAAGEGSTQTNLSVPGTPAGLPGSVGVI
ncbi:MAG: hypothetical protein M1814_005448 [Vezdaea aestivalis]|nr:MAG: hypothetical protein M1814_005448 [Vezdaea aestivalis]